MLTPLLRSKIRSGSATLWALTCLVLGGMATAQSHHPPATSATAPEVAPPPERPPEALAVDPVAAPEQDYLVHEYVLVEIPEIDPYLRDIEDKLLLAAKATIPAPRIVVFSADEFNASTDPNGIIMISTGTLRALESEDELAALLGHELSHALLKHPRTKTLLSRFPAGFEITGAVVATAGQQTAAAGQWMAATQGKTTGPTPASATTFATQSLRTSKDTSLFWSDLLAPSWNRDEERQADRKGSELMQAAGYDWTAFDTLLDKMHAAEAKRSARLQQLRRKMIDLAQQQASAATNGGKQPPDNTSPTDLLPPGGIPTPSAVLNPTYITKIGLALLRHSSNLLSEKAVNAIFDEVDKKTKDYDSPTERRRLLSEYHNKSPAPPGDLSARAPRFADILQNGRGGALLKADAAALRTLAALESGDMAKAGEAAAALMPVSKAEPPKVDPASAAGRHSAKAKVAKSPKRTPEEQKKPAEEPTVQQVAGDPASLSPHLNFALAKWYLQQRKTDLAEVATVRWMNFAHAPLQAFLLRAALQADRKEFPQAATTLKDGERRLGRALPFLPQMVTYARGAEDAQGAESFARQCNEEERKQTSALQRLVGSKVGPIYTECMLRLGYDPDKPHAPLNSATHEPASQPVAALDKPAAAR